MPGLKPIFEKLARLDDPSVDHALAAALPTADPVARRLIVRTLLDRGRPDGCTGLVYYYHLFEPQLQQLVDGHTPELWRSIRAAVRHRHTQAPANAVRMIRRALAARLSYLVTEQLRSGDAKLAQLSAEALLWLAQHASTARTGGMRPPIDPTGAADLAAAVETAAVHYPAHQQRRVLEALCHLLPRPMPRSQSALSDAEHAAVGPMRSLLAEADRPSVRRALIWALNCQTLAEPALAGLRRCCAEGTLGEALELSHLLPLAGVRRAMGRSATTDMLWPDAQQVRQMTAHQQRQLPRWAGALTGSREQRAARLVDLGACEDAGVRLAALRRLLAMSSGQPTEGLDNCIARFTTDADAAIARVAVWHLLRRRHSWVPQMLTKLVNSPHESVRRIAAQQLAPVGFERLWEGWPQLTFAQRLACGRALVKIDRDFHRHLAERLAGADHEARLRALSIIGDLQQGAFFTPALIQLARDQDAYIAASAVSALGSAEGEEAIGVLRQSLEHADARVRANAVESLAKLESTDHVQELVKLAGDEANRPRANAIAVLMSLRTGDAMAALHRMLDDRRPEHRGSALWLVEQMGLLEVVREVAEMSISDPEREVRRRAERVVAEMIETMHRSHAAAAS